MPNSNYRSGVRTERQRKKWWESKGFATIRAAGSHGFWDLVCVSPNEQVYLVQVKRCETKAQARRLMDRFRESPSIPNGPHYKQVMEVYVAKTREVLTCEA